MIRRMNLVWYGERGVVNAIVTHLAQMPDGVRQFLERVQWANGTSPEWLARVENTACVVELGLSEFGNPDLILVCSCGGKDWPYCVFIEAKLTTYADSAIANTLGMEERGFNSSCNGQLSLKYRFAKALEVWKGEPQIVELDKIHQAYRRTCAAGGLCDPQQTPRKLAKRSIIELLKRLLMPPGALTATGIPPDRFHFVALTWDREPFFTASPDILPRFRDESGGDAWDQLKSRIGWIGYQKLAAVAGMEDAIETPLQLMLGGLLQPATPSIVSNDMPKFKSLQINRVRIADLPQGMQALTRSIRDSAIKHFGQERVTGTDAEGSLSVRLSKNPADQARVWVKVVPHPNNPNRHSWLPVYLGLKPPLPLEQWSGLKTLGVRLFGVNPQEFEFVILPPDSHQALATA